MQGKFYTRLLFLLCCLLPVSGFSQYFYFYANPFAFGTQVSRYTTGINFVNVTAEYTGVVPRYDTYHNAVGDTFITRTLKSSNGAGYAVGVTMPILRTGRRSSFDLSVDLHFNSYIFTDVNEGVTSAGENYLPGGQISLATVTNQIALPLSIDFKSGSDAIAIRTTRFGFVLGAGVMPKMQSTTYSGFSSTTAVIDNKSTTTFTPFAKAEFSAYWLFCFRVKAFYSFGGAQLMQIQSLSANSITPITSTLTEKSSMVISLTVLPFSFLWYKERKSHGWWDDYETERPWRIRE